MTQRSSTNFPVLPMFLPVGKALRSEGPGPAELLDVVWRSGSREGSFKKHPLKAIQSTINMTVSSLKKAVGRKNVKISRSAKQDFMVISEEKEEKQDGSKNNHPQSISQNRKKKDLGYSSEASNQKGKNTVNEQVEGFSEKHCQLKSTQHTIKMEVSHGKKAVKQKNVQLSRSEPALQMSSDEEKESHEGNKNKQSQVKKQRKKCEANEIEVSKYLCDFATDDSDDDGFTQKRKAGETYNQQFSRKENEKWDRPTKRTSKNKNKVKKQIHTMDDHDDLTWSSEGASEDYEFPSVNYKNLTFLAKQHGKHYKDSFNQLEIQNTALSCKSHAERNKNYYKKLTDNIKALETMIIFLKMKLFKTKGINLQLYHQRCESEQKLHSLRVTKLTETYQLGECSFTSTFHVYMSFRRK
ncbi:ankyrin repeat domain-containing protein 26-like [Nycticebus coucang]|uniref:ankyrin repeat domain-containing protein 26-like n=1 Tax=Nycticebus coucang TaxID=9470 RepID=UPI00234C3B3D|nr:ankyrin repeat domain-containing protein 26-like [Nycticebus coucang]